MRHVSEAAERHADAVLAAAQLLEAEVKRLKAHAKAVRANMRTGRFYTDSEIANFEMHKVADVKRTAELAAAAARGED